MSNKFFTLALHLSQDYPSIYSLETEILLEEVYGFKILEKGNVGQVHIFKLNKDVGFRMEKQSYYIREIMNLIDRSAGIKKGLIVLSDLDDRESLDMTVFKKVIPRGSTIAIHIHDFSGGIGERDRIFYIEKMYEGLKSLNLDFKVSLSNPELIVSMYVLQNGMYYMGIEFHSRKKFGERRPSKRPVFSPFSLEPKLSRLLINLSGVSSNSLLIDPFCGVGGIPVEASLFDIEYVCMELKLTWCRGAYKNLHWINNLSNGDVVSCDSLEPVVNLDSIKYHVATDPPYGRITSVSTGQMDIYKRFIDVYVSRSLGSSFFTHVDISDYIEDIGVKVVGMFKIPVHRGLTRYLYVTR